MRLSWSCVMHMTRTSVYLKIVTPMWSIARAVDRFVTKLCPLFNGVTRFVTRI